MSETNPAPAAPSEPGLLQRMREGINWRATFLTTAALTFAGNAALHTIDWPEGSTLARLRHDTTIYDTQHYTQATFQDEHRSHSISIDSHPLQSYTSRTSYDLSGGSEQYAREFSNDPHAGRFIDPNRIAKVVAGLKHQIHDGSEFRSFTFTGYASAEDDTTGGGLTTPSQKNVALAARRAAVAEQELEASITASPVLAKAAKHAKFTVAEAHEQQLAPSQVSSIAHAAKSSGFANSKSMVEAWNTNPQSVSRQDRQLLDRILGSARKVTIDIIRHRNGKSVWEDDKYCTKYLIDSYKDVPRKERFPVFIWPIPLPIPIPKRSPKLPWSRKRRPEEGEPEANGISETLVTRSSGGVGEQHTSLWVRHLQKRDARLERRRQEGRLRRYGRRALGWSIVGLAVSAVNVSGGDCHGHEHGPLPLLIDVGRDLVRYGVTSAGPGADVHQTFSLGIPFDSHAQLELERNQGNLWLPDPAAPCEKSGNGVSKPTRPPHCSTVRIIRENGQETGRQTLVQAGPFQTKITHTN